MTTDITELAQREKFEAWFVNDVVGVDVNFPAFKDGEYAEGEIYDEQLYFMLQAMWMAWKAANAELVEALEKSESRLHEVAVACATAEQALEKAQRYIEELREWNAGLAQESFERQQRIAELESRSVTVKLASRRLPSDYVDGEFGNDDLAAIHNACRLECKVSVEKYLSAHGIVVKWEDE